LQDIPLRYRPDFYHLVLHNARLDIRQNEILLISEMYVSIRNSQESEAVPYLLRVYWSGLLVFWLARLWRLWLSSLVGRLGFSTYYHNLFCCTLHGERFHDRP